jgi:uncharacterized protein (UPF0276 family)
VSPGVVHLTKARPSAPAVLGVGLPYMDRLPLALYDAQYLDYIEVTPEALCRQVRTGDGHEIVLSDHLMAPLKDICAHLPMVVHGVELSIGSAHGWNQSYIHMLKRFRSCLPFLWHSEHLSFQTVQGPDGLVADTGIPLPLPATQEVLDMVVGRCRALQAQFEGPFLLENPVHYLSDLPHDPTVGDDIDLMNQVCQQSDSYMLLDLHNVYCNAVNHGFDAWAAVQRFDLNRVMEIHVSGGRLESGYWTDAHEGRVPDPVWALLESTLPLCPNVRGVTYEIFPDYVDHLGVPAIIDELRTARSIWAQRAGKLHGAA